MEKATLVKTVMDGVDKNLPSILTGLGEAGWVATAGYSVYAGWKLKEEFSKKDVDTKERVKRVAKITAPIVGGVLISSGLIIAANKEYASRCAAIGAACAIGNPEVREKLAETVGIDRKKMDKNDAKPMVKKVRPSDSKKVVMHDLVTGMIFETNLIDFWASVNMFNTAYTSQFGYQPISQFYSILFETDDYEGRIEAHERKCFSPDLQFDPTVDVELGPDWEPRYTIEYDYRSGEDL